MQRRMVKLMLALTIVASAALGMQAQSAATPYVKMAPVAKYMMANRSAEIALARSAAPASISAKAEVMVLGKNGYEVAVPGSNHYVCLVERSWDAPIGAPGYWNFNIRGPDCLNAAAAKSYLPILLLKTRLALSGKSQAQIAQDVQAAFQQKKLPAMEPGALCYMLSKGGYLDDQAKNWHPHLMFIQPLAMSQSWGANLPGSPVLASDDASDHLTIFMVPVAHWSDGSPDSARK